MAWPDSLAWILVNIGAARLPFPVSVKNETSAPASIMVSVAFVLSSHRDCEPVVPCCLFSNCHTRRWVKETLGRVHTGRWELASPAVAGQRSSTLFHDKDLFSFMHSMTCFRASSSTFFFFHVGSLATINWLTISFQRLRSSRLPSQPTAAGRWRRISGYERRWAAILPAITRQRAAAVKTDHVICHLKRWNCLQRAFSGPLMSKWSVSGVFLNFLKTFRNNHDRKN